MRLLLCLLLLPTLAMAQPADSVVVTGRIKNLTVRLYRESPNVVVARTNVARGGSEQAFLAPLQPDGQFRVAVPVLYPLEEMTVQMAGASAGFLVAAGQVRIDIDADSLFVAAVPFRFGGVNAQVNQQHAQYQAFAYQQQKVKKTERERIISRASGGSPTEMYRQLQTAFTAPLALFSAQQTVFPLVQTWVRANAAYEAAALVFDRAAQEGPLLPRELVTQLLTGGGDTAGADLLTPARALTLARFGAYASARIAQQNAGANRGVKVRLLASLLAKYGRGLTAADQQRLAAMRETGSARTADLRYLSGLVERNPDTLNRLMLYENGMQTARPLFDSSAVDYLKAYTLTSVVGEATLNTIRFFGQYIRPQLGDTRIRQAFDEVVSTALRDTALVRQARTDYLAFEKKTGINYGSLGNGINVTTGTYQDGEDLLKNALDRQRGRAVYVVLWSPEEENGRYLARDAQRLLDVFGPRDFTLLYVALSNSDETLWLESIVRNRLRGEHIRFNTGQTAEVAMPLNLYEESPVRLFTPQGKLVKRSAALPDEFEKLVEQIRGTLR
jgi:hypothetical protein